MTGTEGRRSATAVERALLLVLWASVFNGLADLLAQRRSLFLYDLRERFDDYFAFILSFDPHTALAPARFFTDRVAASPGPGFPKLSGIEGLPHEALTHLFVPPLTTSYCLITAALMRVIDPSLLYLATLAGLGTYWLHLVARYGPPDRRAALAVLGFVAYPTLAMVTRGNVYSGAAALLIIHALMVAARGEKPVLAAVLLAVAVNIRPNAAPLLLPLLALLPRRLPAIGAFVAAGALVFVVSLSVAQLLYPDYTLATFLRGVENYHWHYVERAHGVAYGSSLYGALVLLLGAQPWQEAVGAAAALSIVAAGAWLQMRRALVPATLLFLTLAAYTLGSTVIGDYHLLVFVLPLLLPGERSAATWIAQAAAALMLAPKNLFAIDALSIQVLLNPAILLAATIAVIALEWRTRRAPAAAWRPALA